MVAIPNPPNIIDYLYELKNLVFSRSFSDNNIRNHQQIFSFSQEIDAIDPLIFFSVMQESNRVSFYWQNNQKKEAIVAIGAIKILNINSLKKPYHNKYRRFDRCQDFILDNQKFITYTNKDVALHHSHFFSYFSFFTNSNSDNNFANSSIFLPFLQLTKKGEKYILTINTYNKIELVKKYLNQRNFTQQLQAIYQHQTYQPHNTNYYINEKQYDGFKDKVKNGLKTIATKKLTKIVVAHALEVKTKDNFNIIKSLQNLRKNHPDCYIFAIGNQAEEYFIGASPERLLSIHQNQLISDALAGSAPRGKNLKEDTLIGEQLLRGEKEKREHQVVGKFIYEQLKKMNLSPRKDSLQLLKLSNIQHLWTPIYAELKNNIHPLEIVAKLHPTPAVAGSPVDIACQEIAKSEDFERSLYASPIGWINMNGDCEFIVGIRSALIKQNKATLYAGAGIVAGSQPEQELIEIKLKFQALLQALI